MNKYLHSPSSSLTARGRYDPNLAHLRQRAEEARLEIGDGLCAGCYAALTETDVDAGECTQCRTTIDTIDDKGESE